MGENKDLGANGRWQYPALYDPFWRLQSRSKPQATPNCQCHHVGHISRYSLVGMGVCQEIQRTILEAPVSLQVLLLEYSKPVLLNIFITVPSFSDDESYPRSFDHPTFVPQVCL